MYAMCPHVLQKCCCPGDLQQILEWEAYNLTEVLFPQAIKANSLLLAFQESASLCSIAPLVRALSPFA